MSLDQWRALPEEPEYRVELQEGVRIVSPRPTSAHARAVFRLCAQVDEALWLVGKRSRRSRSSILRRRPRSESPISSCVVAMHPNLWSRRDVAIAIDIVSPGSRRTDHVTKRSEYAVDAGSPTTGSSTWGGRPRSPHSPSPRPRLLRRSGDRASHRC